MLCDYCANDTAVHPLVQTLLGTANHLCDKCYGEFGHRSESGTDIWRRRIRKAKHPRPRHATRQLPLFPLDESGNQHGLPDSHH